MTCEPNQQPLPAADARRLGPTSGHAVGAGLTLTLAGRGSDAPEAVAPSPSLEPARSPIEAWLDGFAAMLGGQKLDAESIRDELSDHLSGRTRDLMLSGLSEAQAARQAIDELGEAGEVAARYRKLQQSPRRRSIMYGTLFGVSAAAVVLSVASIVGRPAGDEALLRLQMAQSQDREASLRAALEASLQAERNVLAPTTPMPNDAIERRHALLELAAARSNSKQPTAVATAFTPHHPSEKQASEVSLPTMDFNGAKLSDLLEAVAAAAKVTLDVDWHDLERGGPQAADPVTIKTGPMPLNLFLEKLSRALPMGERGRSLDYRVANGVLRVASRAGLDRAEVQLVSYDVSRIVESWSARFSESTQEIMDKMREAIEGFVEPDDWANNGGELGKISIVGDRLFIQAPARFHPKIQWVLEQVGSDSPISRPTTPHPAPPAPNPAGAAPAPTPPAAAAPGMNLRLENGRVVLDSGGNRLVRAERMQLELNADGCIGTASGQVELITDGRTESKRDQFPLRVK